MSYDVLRVIQEAVAAGSLVADPDRERYPELFKSRQFTVDELARHRATYKPITRYIPNAVESMRDDPFDESSMIQRFVPIAGEFKVKPKSYLSSTGWRVNKDIGPVYQVQPDTWIDLSTGEVLSKSDARKAGLYIPNAESVSDRSLRVRQLIYSCAPSERDFIRYILHMRNARGGFLVPLVDALDTWVACKYPRILHNHKARKRAALKAILYKRGILHDDQTLTRPFQILGNSTKRDILGEAASAHLIIWKWRERLNNAQ